MSSAARPDPDAAAMSAMAQIARGVLASQGGDLSYGTLKRGFRELAQRDPIDTLLVTVIGGSYLFYLSEKGKNPKVESIWDAVVFITTCLSVGYDDVFARTPTGKAIASFVMTIGPAAANAVFNAPASEKAAPAPEALQALELQRSIVERLDGILEALKKLPAPAQPPST